MLLSARCILGDIGTVPVNNYRVQIFASTINSPVSLQFHSCEKSVKESVHGMLRYTSLQILVDLQYGTVRSVYRAPFYVKGEKKPRSHQLSK